MGIDVAVAELIQYTVSPQATSFFRTITHLGDWYFIVGVYLCIAAYYLLTKRHRSFKLLIALVVSAVLVTGLKYSIGRARPEVMQLFSQPLTSAAFPSWHATISLVFYGYLAYHVIKHCRGFPQRLAVLVVTTVLVWLVGFSRIYLGVHWISDVLAGWVLGAVILAGLIAVDRYKKPTSKP